MPENRLSDNEEQRLIGSVRDAISQTNTGIDPNKALAKSAAAKNYEPEFVGRMVEMYNTSRTLAHLKNASGAKRANDFPLASTDKVLAIMFPKRANVTDLPRGFGETGKAANLMKMPRYETPGIEKAAEYLPDGGLKVKKVMDKLADMKRSLIDMRTDYTAASMRREAALHKVATYFRTPGHKAFEDVDAEMQSMFGKAGSLVMDVVWGAIGTPAREKRASVQAKPRLADLAQAPYSHVNEFVEQSKRMAKIANDQRTLEADIAELDKGFKARLSNFPKKAGIADTVFGNMISETLQGNPVTGGSGSAPGRKALEDATQAATDPAHESIIKGIQTESMLQDLIANDPVVAKYDPADVVDAYNDISKFAPISSTQPAVLRGYLRRMLESSPNVKGRVMEGFEANQLADIETKMRTQPDVIKQMLTPSPAGGPK